MYDDFSTFHEDGLRLVQLDLHRAETDTEDGGEYMDESASNVSLSSTIFHWEYNGHLVQHSISHKLVQKSTTKQRIAAAREIRFLNNKDYQRKEKQYHQLTMKGSYIAMRGQIKPSNKNVHLFTYIHRPFQITPVIVLTTIILETKVILHIITYLAGLDDNPSKSLSATKLSGLQTRVFRLLAGFVNREITKETWLLFLSSP